MNSAVDVLVELLPSLIRWVETELQAGRDPKKQLQAAMDAADIAADGAEDAKFPR